MIGYTYLEHYIVTIEYDDYESCSKIINAENALYKTNNFKIIEIEDFNHKSLDMTNIYKKNTIYNGKIYFWINKQIVFDKKIYDYKRYKKLAIPIPINYYSHPVDKVLNKLVPKYKLILETYFNDIIENGCSGIYKSYYPNGVIHEEYFHNNGEIEGEYKKYHENGKMKETCNYLNGLKHGRWKEFDENEELKFCDDYINGVLQFFIITYLLKN